MKECDDTSNLQLVRYSSWNFRYQTDMNQCSESIYAWEATVIGITPACNGKNLLSMFSSAIIYKRCSHPNKAIPGNYRINVTDPKLKYICPLAGWKGEKMKELQHRKMGSAARCAQKVTGMRNTHQKSLYPSRSRGGWWSWIFWFVRMAHAIWAWKGIYRVIGPFKLKPLGITMRPHIQHLALETFPSGNKTKEDTHQIVTSIYCRCWEHFKQETAI